MARFFLGAKTCAFFRPLCHGAAGKASCHGRVQVGNSGFLINFKPNAGKRIRSGMRDAGIAARKPFGNRAGVC
jgi:hypothetical protein